MAIVAIAAARKLFAALDPEEQKVLVDSAKSRVDVWARTKALGRPCTCPACGSLAAMAGESLSRGPVRIDEDAGAIVREVRVLPNRMLCVVCGLDLKGFQELNEAGLGAIYTAQEEEDPIEFFGIVPEEHVDVDELIRERQEEEWGYQNE